MKKHHWLVAGNVIATGPKGQVGQKGLNTLITTEQPIFTREDLSRAQNGLMHRFVTETPQEKGAKIVDVFILSVNNLGLMTQEEFDGAFAAADGQPVPEVN